MTSGFWFIPIPWYWFIWILIPISEVFRSNTSVKKLLIISHIWRFDTGNIVTISEFVILKRCMQWMNPKKSMKQMKLKSGLQEMFLTFLSSHADWQKTGTCSAQRAEQVWHQNAVTPPAPAKQNLWNKFKKICPEILSVWLSLVQWM